MKDRIELELKAVDFKGTAFYSCQDCAIEKAVTRQTGLNEVAEGVDVVNINGVRYCHEYYGLPEFQIDKSQARKLGFNNTTIRTITLIKR